jgi:uncharacterized protein (TIGR03083 family)
MPFDVAEAPALYHETRTAFVALLRDLSDAQASTQVVSCPGWSVKDVMAHVSGLVAETLAGVPLPRGSDEATARQVNNRAEWSLDDVCDEWLENAASFAAYGEQDPAYVAALTADLVVHASDIAEVLGLSIDIDDVVVSKVAERYGEGLQSRAIDAAGVALGITFTDGADLDAPENETADRIQLTVSAFDFLRSVTGRRSRAEVEALAWSSDPAHLLDTGWSQYGAFKK